MISDLSNCSLRHVKGLSMKPFIVPGDTILFDKISITGLIPGTILLYRMQGVLTCHRLVKVKKENNLYFAYCRGDASSSLEKVELSVLEGEALFILRGTRIIDLKTRWQKICGIFIVLFLAPVSLFLNRIYRKIKS